MKPVERTEILDLQAYEEARPELRKKVIDLKKVRRVALGGHMTVLFENHDTVLFQVQEMLRTERIVKEAAIEHELETYNELIPAENELAATIFVEYPDAEERDRMLVALAGLEDKFYLEVGDERAAVRNETKGTRTDRTTAVHYVKFPLPAQGADALRGGGVDVHLGVDHPAYSARVALAPETIQALAADLG